MNITQIKSIPIPTVLAHFGKKPSAIKNNSYWYLAWDRAENTPSVRVDLSKNLYIDYGSGEGGSVIDVALKLGGFSGMAETLSFLKSLNVSPGIEFEGKHHSQKSSETSENGIEVLKVTNLTHPALIRYIIHRGIDVKLAKKYCKEVRYLSNGREYFSIGFENDLGGFELRNSIYKNSTSPKCSTWIKNGSEALIILEGFIDFLSFLTVSNEGIEEYDFLILNSVSFVNNIDIKTLQNYDGIFLYLDNDEAGKNASYIFLSSDLKAIDCSCLYEHHKDINDWLMNRQS